MLSTVLETAFSISFKINGSGIKFLILGFKNKLTSATLIFLIAISFDVISLKFKLSFKKLTDSSL